MGTKGRENCEKSDDVNTNTELGVEAAVAPNEAAVAPSERGIEGMRARCRGRGLDRGW